MSFDPDETARLERAAEDAARWFVRLASDEVDEVEWRAFSDWLAAAPENLEAYEAAERISIELDGYASDAAKIYAARRAPTPRRRVRQRFGLRRVWPAVGSALAAGVVLAVMVGVFRPTPPAPGNAATPAAVLAFSTATGERRAVVLQDGTQLELNTATRVTVSFSGSARRVRLVQGEAAFVVAHQVDRPFLVDVGDRIVRDIGTEFDILRLGDKTTVTVARGIVSVESAGEARTQRLTVGDQLAHTDGATASRIRRVDPEQILAWRAGRLIYRDASLSDVAGDVSRYFDTPIRIGDPGVGRIRFSGVLVLGSEESVVQRLQGFLPMRTKVTRAGGAIVLLPAS